MCAAGHLSDERVISKRFLAHDWHTCKGLRVEHH